MTEVWGKRCREPGKANQGPGWGRAGEGTGVVADVGHGGPGETKSGAAWKRRGTM